MLAAYVSNWLRPGAVTSPERLFCHVYWRGEGQAQMIPGRPYSVIAALEPGRTSWTAVLDAVQLGPMTRSTRPAPNTLDKSQLKMRHYTSRPFMLTNIVPGPSLVKPISTWPPDSRRSATGKVRWAVVRGST